MENNNNSNSKSNSNNSSDKDNYSNGFKMILIMKIKSDDANNDGNNNLKANNNNEKNITMMKRQQRHLTFKCQLMNHFYHQLLAKITSNYIQQKIEQKLITFHSS